tara:strand:- start:29 stop:1894 length:1866 start_codon:yes stop_codon:yes gene_type:complete
MANVFDQFDEVEQEAGNVFDQFDDQPQPESLTEAQYFERFGDAPDIDGLIKPEIKQEEEGRSIGETLEGVGEAALTLGTGAVGGTLGLLGGTLQGVISELRSGEFGSNEAANRIADRAEAAMADFTYAPRSEAGQEIVGAIGEAGEALAPLAGLSGPLTQAGQLGRAARPQIAQAGAATSKAVAPVKEAAKGVFEYQSPTKQRIGRLLEAGEADVETAKFKLKSPKPDVEIRGVEGNLLEAPTPSGPIPETASGKFKRKMDIGGPKVVKDKAATESIKQGFDEGVIAAVKAGSKEDKAKMAKMVKIMEQGKRNKAFAIKNRPSDVAGDSLMERVKSVRSVNRKAGAELGVVAEKLKGQKVDSSPAVNTFIGELDEMGIKIGDDLKPIFEGSDIEGVTGAENVVRNIVRRMSDTKTPDGHDIHRLKKYIDEQVTYGKTTEGLTGKTESVLKSLRRNLDGILDEKFPEYDNVNTTYKDTITALDAIQDVAGRKMDLSGGSADKATGTLLRRLMSNAQSRVRLLDSIDEIESVAGKYGAKFSDDLLSQTLFVDELDRMFGPVARTSLQGQVGQAVEGAGRAVASPTGVIDLAIKGAGKVGDKLQGINEANAFKSIKDLLKDQGI